MLVLIPVATSNCQLALRFTRIPAAQNEVGASEEQKQDIAIEATDELRNDKQDADRRRESVQRVGRNGSCSDGARPPT
jgi:hypothetical protein